MATKKSIFKAHLGEWLSLQGDREKRSEMAKEISRIAKIHIKSVSRSFKRVQMTIETGEEKRGRNKYYTPDVISALYDIWDVANQPCGELLLPLMKDYVTGFKQLSRWKHTDEATRKLFEMSLATLKRIIKSLRIKHGIYHGRSTTSPSALKHLIPIFKGPWDNLAPGNGQIDTVAHCGNSLFGDYVFTVSFVDSATYWGVRRAQWNKGQMATKNNLITIKERLPFPWIMAHPDTGSEFINWIAKEWCEQNDIQLTRSEPGKKNDNMYVEERNGHVVRKYLGYERLDTAPEIVEIINEYYYYLDLYLNHFQSVRRTLSKERIGSKIKRNFEKKAETPFQRVMNHKKVPSEIKFKIQKEHESLNPLLLKENLDKLKKKIFNFQHKATKTVS